MPLITDMGFSYPSALDYVPAAEIGRAVGIAQAVSMTGCDSACALAPYFDRISLIAIAFPNFADGRGFSLAKRLRDLGYRGRLRAIGPIISDQYTSARACGFDEIEIDDALAARQPESHWQVAVEMGKSYRSVLMHS